MPELAEVEFYRKQWDRGIGAKITTVALHSDKRIFRGTETRSIRNALSGVKLISSEARGKQMAFRFSKGIWLGIHLGMTGKLRVEPLTFTPGKHDHLVLFQRDRALVFSDPRQFGRILFYQGRSAALWWTKLPPELVSNEFTLAALRTSLRRHSRLPIKAALLLQSSFPGIGNWMADEILWQARLHPRMAAGTLSSDDQHVLWKTIRDVCRKALKHVGQDFSDPPKGWLFHERWQRGGLCPRHRTKLECATIGGRTTVWCAKCQLMALSRDGRSRLGNSG